MFFLLVVCSFFFFYRCWLLFVRALSSERLPILAGLSRIYHGRLWSTLARNSSWIARLLPFSASFISHLSFLGSLRIVIHCFILPRFHFFRLVLWIRPTPVAFCSIWFNFDSVSRIARLLAFLFLDSFSGFYFHDLFSWCRLSNMFLTRTNIIMTVILTATFVKQDCQKIMSRRDDFTQHA